MQREAYCTYRSHDHPRWALHGAEEVIRQGGGRALMGLPWGSTDACNFPLPPCLPLYLGDRASGAFTLFHPLPSISSLLPPALLLPQIAVGLLESC